MISDGLVKILIEPRMRQKMIYGGQREFDPLMDFVVRTSVFIIDQNDDVRP